MTTLNEMIEIIRAENPNGLRAGNDEIGYIDLTADEYEAQIIQWAQGRLNTEARIAAAIQVEQAKKTAEAKLAALGITTDDLKALGL
jgi:hypothetical protein